jgi:hypothetical protein
MHGGMYSLNDCNLKCPNNADKILEGQCYDNCLMQVINKKIKSDIETEFDRHFKQRDNTNIKNIKIQNVTYIKNALYNALYNAYSYLNTNEFTIMQIVFVNNDNNQFANGSYMNHHFVIIAKDNENNCLLFDPKWNILLKNNDALQYNFPENINTWIELIKSNNNKINQNNSNSNGMGYASGLNMCAWDQQNKVHQQKKREISIYDNEHNTVNSSSIITDLNIIINNNNSLNDNNVIDNQTFKSYEFTGWIRKNVEGEFFIEKNQVYSNFIMNTFMNFLTCNKNIMKVARQDGGKKKYKLKKNTTLHKTNKLKFARKKAIKLGATMLEPSTRKNNKYMVIYKDKKIHFGHKDYNDYLDHKDKTRRKNYLNRARNIRTNKGKGKLTRNNKHMANFWAINILW